MQTAPERVAGILVPLFSLRSEPGWGIGEIPDIARFSEWLADAGHGLLQLLPINEVSPGEHSPYSSLSAFALDPVYVALEHVEDFRAAGGEGSLDRESREALESARAASRVQYGAVRELKHVALRSAFRHFQGCELATGSRRTADFQAFLDEHREWIHDYALFRALHQRYPRHWETWEPALRERHPAALEAQRQALAEDVLFYQYVQWLADRQWRAARSAAAACGVRLKGDLPFMVSGHSADVWANQDQFRLDASVGAPPDAFSADGQNWGLPPYNWEVMERNGFEWLRRRAQRSAQCFDYVRVDHVVGFFRTYTRPKCGAPLFLPSEEPDQLKLGTRLMQIFQSGGAQVMAEDLGVIPNFVRRALTEMGIPGYRVLRWEKEWDAPGQPFRDPRAYPARSVAVSSTHDTETLAVWWESMGAAERRDICRVPALCELNPETTRYFDSIVHQALLETLYGAGSQFTILPIQDVLGSRERINVPATVGPENWTYRLPMTLSALRADWLGREAADRVAGCALRHRRSLYDKRAL